MQTTTIARKCLVVGITLFFIDMSLIPKSSGNVVNNNTRHDDNKNNSTTKLFIGRITELEKRPSSYHFLAKGVFIIIFENGHYGQRGYSDGLYMLIQDYDVQFGFVTNHRICAMFVFR